jgi:hypothetical protein
VDAVSARRATVSPAATVIVVPPFRLQLADVGLRTTDPVMSGVAAGRAVVGLAEVGGERLRIREFRCGCTCLASVCEIEPVASGLLLERDVSALQAATAMVISASATARAEDREHNISRTRETAGGLSFHSKSERRDNPFDEWTEEELTPILAG